jgi:PAS domain-containing protein
VTRGAALALPRSLGKPYLAAAVLGFAFFVVLAWLDLQGGAVLRAAFTLVAGALIAATFLVLRREIAMRSRGQQELAEANARLDIDIRERTRNLEESEARVHGIINSATDAIISIDEAQTIVLTNPAARDMFR